MKRISQYFLQGLLFLVPLVVTIYVIYWVFVKIDGVLNFPVPGIGFLATVVGFSFFFSPNVSSAAATTSSSVRKWRKQKRSKTA